MYIHTHTYTWNQVPFAVEIFVSNTEGVSDTLVFAFETPGGFWTIGWHVPGRNMYVACNMKCI